MPANIHATKRIKYETIFKCKVLGVRESGYYSWRKGMEKRNQKRQEERRLIKLLEKILWLIKRSIDIEKYIKLQ